MSKENGSMFDNRSNAKSGSREKKKDNQPMSQLI